MNLKKKLKQLEKDKKNRSVGYRKWEKKRKEWFEYYKKNPTFEAPTGELANILDFLTPKGYDKEGRKVSFVEAGKPGISNLNYS